MCYKSITNGDCADPFPDLVKISHCCCRCKPAGWGEPDQLCEECPIEGSNEFTQMCPHGCGISPNGDGRI